ncbi:MAG: helix-turn-helix domain-containing protein [Oligoflexales bacterium]|nr:helix-turn-helix domain-containing protein [Oligoflexales bacterium]
MEIKLLTTKEVAQILRCDVTTVSKMCKAGKIIGTKMFGDWKIPERELYQTIQQQINWEKLSLREEGR